MIRSPFCSPFRADVVDNSELRWVEGQSSYGNVAPVTASVPRTKAPSVRSISPQSGERTLAFE